MQVRQGDRRSAPKSVRMRGCRSGRTLRKKEMKDKKRKRRKKKSGKGASNDEGKGKADTLMTNELADVRGGPVAPLRPRYLSSLLSTANSMTGGPTVSARLLLFPLLGVTVVKVLLIGLVVSP